MNKAFSKNKKRGSMPSSRHGHSRDIHFQPELERWEAIITNGEREEGKKK